MGVVAGASLGNWTIDPANGSPYGITIDPTVATGNLWIVDYVADRIYEYTGARSRTSGSQNAAKSYALNSANSSPQGIADPPPPQLLATASTGTVTALEASIPLVLAEPVLRKTDPQRRLTPTAHAVDHAFTNWQPHEFVQDWPTLTRTESTSESDVTGAQRARTETTALRDWMIARETLFLRIDNWLIKTENFEHSETPGIRSGNQTRSRGA